MGHKAAETTHNINNAFGPGSANEHIAQQWFKKFCKGDESLEDAKHSGQPSGIDKDPLRAIINTDSLTTMQEVAEKLNINHSTATWCLKKIGKVKKLDKWVPHELTKKKKKLSFWSVVSYSIQQQQFFSWIVMCNKKWILYDNQRWPALRLEQEEVPKHFPKPNLHQ